MAANNRTLTSSNRQPHAPAGEPDESRLIQPCPFSRGYRIALASAWRSLLIYESYRLVLSGMLLSLPYAKANHPLLQHSDPKLFQAVALAYFVLVLVNGLTLLLRRPGYATQAQVQIFVDIAAIALLTHAAGGALSGLGILLAVTMAAGGLLIGGRCAWCSPPWPAARCWASRSTPTSTWPSTTGLHLRRRPRRGLFRHRYIGLRRRPAHRAQRRLALQRGAT
ncbi:hypothetical protein [Methylogaea oryzae]|uniref:hypothetical protein n=1 Tax=Methylogaea oryzae TaxID=1295382 RepID=UPI0006D06AF3|nr:hypothetical protein [Methylogaea oryzae]